MSDTNDESLEEFLRFLYTDECDLTADNAVFMLYLAKKYIVPALTQKCIEFFEANLVVESAVTIVQQAIQFDEKKLERKCWELIDLKTTEVIASDAFVDINLATLETLLKRESLKTTEVALFRAVLRWGEAECTRKEIEVNGKNKRAAIGNAIYQIRFVAMTLQEFGQNVSQSGILTPEENIMFYDKLSGVERASEVWNLSERRAREGTLLRCCRFDHYGLLSVRSGQRASEHTLCVSFDSPVNFHGVHLLGNKQEEYDVTLDFISQSVRKKCRSQCDSRGVSGFDVMLPVPIQVQANYIVGLKVTVKSCQFANTYASVGRKGSTAVETNGITVNFFNTPGLHFSKTSVEEGQLDEIIFSET